MNLIHEDDAARQDPRTWATQLGSLAATPSASRPAAVSRLDAIPSAGLPSRLTALLGQLAHRHRRQEHAADKLRAEEFVSGT